MELKIGRYTFTDVTNKDWILDNGACYQCVTLKHMENFGGRYCIMKPTWTQISKKQFKDLYKKGIIVEYPELETDPRYVERYGQYGMKAYRFNVEE